MENYFDLAILVVPVLVVLIAGGLTFWQLNYKNKQEKINKWKEEFRGYIGEYIDLTQHLNQQLIILGKNVSTKSNIDEKLLETTSINSNKLMGIIFKIELLLEHRNTNEKELLKCFHSQWDFMSAAQYGEMDKLNRDLLLPNIVSIAKKVHREYKG